MTHKLLIKCMLGLVVGFSSVVSYAAPLEGFWRTIDDKTGQQVSIVEIKKKADIVKLLYYSYKIRKKLEITHRLSRSTILYAYV